MNKETRVCALTTVPIPPDEAFALFTEEVDTWWRTVRASAPLSTARKV